MRDSAHIVPLRRRDQAQQPSEPAAPATPASGEGAASTLAADG